MSGLLRLIWYAFLAYFVYALIRLIFRTGQRSRPRPKARSNPSAGLMVKDEVCNTYLPREDALREVQGGKEYFFCSLDCRKKFLERPKEGSRPSSPAS